MRICVSICIRFERSLAQPSMRTAPSPASHGVEVTARISTYPAPPARRTSAGLWHSFRSILC